MNKIITLVLSLMMTVAAYSQQLDSTRLAPLDSLLGEYYDAMLYEPLSTKYQECDFLISSCKDSLVRQWVATRILEHYMEPPLMGEEAVGIYVYDKWIASGKITIADDWLAFSANLFADFNRNSMLGMKAPVLQMLPPVGPDKVRVPKKGVLSVLYFYDTSCSKCQATSILLPHVLESVSIPVAMFAIYTGQDGDEWAEFRSSFTCANDKVEIIHLWDPEIESDYQKQYGVLTTPKMFLVSEQGVIEGRRLEVDSLAELLNIYQLYSSNNGKSK